MLHRFTSVVLNIKEDKIVDARFPSSTLKMNCMASSHLCGGQMPPIHAVVLCGIGGYILYRNVSSVVQDAVKEFDKEFQVEEAKLRKLPAADIKTAKLTDIVSAFKANPAEAKNVRFPFTRNPLLSKSI